MNIDGYGRVAIVTGAAQGLGLSIAQRMLEDGKRVALLDVNEEKLNELRLSPFFQQMNEAMYVFMKVDVSDTVAIKDAVRTIMNRWNRIDILINNAGIRRETSIEDITLEEWNLLMNVNLGGTFFFSQAVLEVMKVQLWGRIVNISSFGGQFGPLTSGAHYCASKAGQLVLTKVFARHLADYGITVNTVAPAAIRTPEMDNVDPGKLKHMIASIPVGRVGEAEEVAQLVSYLISDSTNFVTGATFDINGGLLMR
ncbi:SDR family NAD(P)-dependent oxidoreductase [Brevibacillus daliensis]|uniref:SDR family NAD(P)-dependent oxidoreductase n=1 Tax=Brevibacillus daliensis TaxID=2892995 RepID=UPI002102F748